MPRDAFTDLSQDPFLPSIQQDEPLDRLLPSFNDPLLFDDFSDDTLDLHAALLEPFPSSTTTTSLKPVPSSISTTSLPEHTNANDFASPFFHDSPVICSGSHPHTSQQRPQVQQPHHSHHTSSNSSTSASFSAPSPHQGRLVHFSPQQQTPTSPQPTNPSLPHQNHYHPVSFTTPSPYHLLHTLAHSQPPEHPQPSFYRAPSTTRSGRPRAKATERCRSSTHPYHKRENPTSVPPPMQRLRSAQSASPLARLPLGRGLGLELGVGGQVVGSPRMQVVGKPVFKKMMVAGGGVEEVKWLEGGGGVVFSVRTIEVGPPEVIASPTPMALDGGGGVGEGCEGDRAADFTDGERGAVVLGLVSGIERQLRDGLEGIDTAEKRYRAGLEECDVGRRQVREGLSGCERIREILRKRRKEGGDDVETLPLEKETGFSCEASESDNFLKSLEEEEVSNEPDNKATTGASVDIE
ncbi:hypothetical protein K432DRAFT_426937 [Lepidopterella palustris CBS 459.81]|uniref:Uncharacterized protein n=1 Tax=Lepidopterella palustris CBS 459.81 TaxID=1314670 RepID=A0A8E2E7N8_9PEZI|nr:hypothetical protein K432DRAFT_426937 [Lepidopterella palustris CBS 459.81]